MSYTYIARQPILDKNKNTLGYELLFRDGPKNTFPDTDPEFATSRVLSDHFLSNNHNMLGGGLIFVNFPYQSLINLVPKLFPKESLVIEVLEDCEPTDELLNVIKKLNFLGYRIALDDFVPSKKWIKFLPYVSIIKIDVRLFPINEAKRVINSLQYLKITFLAEKIETYKEFNMAIDAGFTMFQGYFFCKPELVKNKVLNPANLTSIQLCKEMSSSSINMSKIEYLFSVDIALSYKLLMYVNTGHILRAEIKSVKQALIYLGESRLRQFIALIIVTSVPEDKPDYLRFMAIQRAYMCETLSNRMNGEGFLTGLLSLLGTLLDQPLDIIIKNIPINDDIKLAILNGKGYLGNLLSMVIAYENADWIKLNKYCNYLKISDEVLLDSYFKAMDFSNNLFKTIRNKKQEINCI